MKKITRDELMTALVQYHPALHCELYRNYRRWYYDDEPLDAEFYFSDGCAIVCSAYEYNGKYNVYCYIHEVSDDCDFAEACRKCKEMSDADCAAHTPYTRTMFLIHRGELSEKLNGFQGFRKFVRMGENFAPDPHITGLTREHADEMKALCNPAVLENDTRFGKREAESFFEWDFDWYEKEGVHLLGYRENGTLLGIASWSAENELNLGWLLDIFVSPDARGRGIGKALVRAAIANLPDRMWLYQAARDNERSVGLARSLGFTLDGANLFVFSDGNSAKSC